MKKVAFYLPQFHNEPLNEPVWGPNFTDWVTSQNNKPIYKGHIQPLVPLNGQYRLDDDALTLSLHAKQAKELGLDGFNFYFYHFDKNTNALRKPVYDYLKSDIDFPFMLTWANHSWTKAWVGEHDVVISEQKFDKETVDTFVQEIIPYISDSRYIRIDNRPAVTILNSNLLNLQYFVESFKFFSKKELGEEISPYLIVTEHNSAKSDSIDLYVGWPPGDVGLLNCQSFPLLKSLIRKCNSKLKLSYLFKIANTVCELKLVNKQINVLKNRNNRMNYSQTILTGWDNTPRYKYNGYQLIKSNLEFYAEGIRSILILNKSANAPITFIKAWNEWAEGNVIEKSESCNMYFDALKVVLSEKS